MRLLTPFFFKEARLKKRKIILLEAAETTTAEIGRPSTVYNDIITTLTDEHNLLLPTSKVRSTAKGRQM